MQEGTHYESQARPQEVKKSRHSELDWLLLFLVMFGHLCILDNDLDWTASMAVIFRLVGDGLGEALWISHMKPGN